MKKYLWLDGAITIHARNGADWAVNNGWFVNQRIDIEKASIIFRKFNLSKRFQAFVAHTSNERNPGVTTSFPYKPFSYKQYLIDKEQADKWYQNYLNAKERGEFDNDCID